MTQTAVPATTTSPTSLRTVYLVRIVFSLLWATLVFTTTSSLVSTDKLTLVAAVLLTVYPLWDAVATLLERNPNRVATINIVLGLVATGAMLAATFATVGRALLVFGVWALFSGAIQLTVAVRRRRTVGSQWPMIISGGLSVLAGASFAARSAAPTSGLSTIAGYSLFGAFWFLVSVIFLTRRARKAGAGS